MAQNRNSKKYCVCPKCGVTNDSNNQYCIDCGSRLVNDFYKVCFKCGSLIEVNDIFCTSCGQNLSNNIIQCPKCDCLNDDQYNFCINCGFQLNKKSISRCPECNKPIDYNSNFCTACGYDLTNESHILFENGKYILYKDNKKIGEFKSEESATVARSVLRKNFWSTKYFSFNNIMNIVKADKLYYVFRYEDGIIIDYGSFYNYIGAKKILDSFNRNIEDDKKIEVKNEEGHFIVYKGYTHYGSYTIRKVAIKVRDILNNHDGNINYFKNNNIFNVDGKYCVLVLKNSKILFKGIYSSRDDAQAFLDKRKGSNSRNNIRITLDFGDYVVRKNNRIFGSFPNRRLANKVKDILEKNNGDISFFKDHNIFKINKKYFVLVLEDSKVVYKGVFPSKNKAQNLLDKNDKKSRIEIKKENQRFIIYKESHKLGSFHNLIIANKVKDILEKNDFKISYFENNNIIEIDKKFCIITLENSTIKYKGSFLSKTKAINFLDRLNNKNKTDNDSVKGIDEVVDDSSTNNKSDTSTDETQNVGNINENKGIDEYDENKENPNKNEGHINQTNDGFIVHNNGLIYGRFESRELAVIVSDNLSKHNWNIKYFLDNPFVRHDDEGVIYVFKIENNLIVSLGNFKTISEAINALKKNS